MTYRYNEHHPFNNCGHFGGLRILESSSCLEETDTPRKKHHIKPWMSKNYHNRIQKKWAKRWGYEMRPIIYETPQGFVCHPTIARALRERLAGRSL